MARREMLEKRIFRNIEAEIYGDRNRPIRQGRTLSVFYGEKGLVAITKEPVDSRALFRDILIIDDQGMELIVMEPVNEDRLYPVYKFRKLDGQEFQGLGWGEEIDLEILGQLGAVVGRDFNNRIPKEVVSYIKERIGRVKRSKSEQC